MSGNLWRTILNVLAIAVGVISSVFNCAVDAAGTTVCSVPWLTPQIGAMIASVLVIMNLVIKAFGTGSVAQNLAAPAVPVVPTEQAKVGVVTAKQVAASGTDK